MESISIHKKKHYSIDLYAVYNSWKRFIYSLTGFSNTTYNSQVRVTIQIHQNPTWYFILGQYLLNNSVYSLTKYMIPLYKVPYILCRSNRKLNSWLSSIHIDIKYVFDLLKSWWKSLTGLRLILINYQ